MPRLPGSSSVNWDSGNLGYYSVYESDPDANFIANVDFTGTDWKARTLRFGGELSNTLVLTDLDADTGRRVDYLQLGYNSDVDLISTRLRFVLGWEGELHDITLGSGYTYAMNLYADRNIVDLGNANVGYIETAGGADQITVGSGRWLGSATTKGGNDTVIVAGGAIDSLNLGEGDNSLSISDGGYVNHARSYAGSTTILLEDNARLRGFRSFEADTTIDLLDTSSIYNLDITEGNGDVSIGSGFIDSIFAWNSDFTLDIAAGGFLGQMRLAGDSSQEHDIRVDGTVGSITVAGDHTTTLKTGAGFVAGVTLGDGHDQVTTGAGKVETIITRDGNDIVNLGTGGADSIRLGEGADKVRIRDLDAGTDLAVHGGEGQDWAIFFAMTEAVWIDLRYPGEVQDIGSSINGSLISLTSIENLQGTAYADGLRGSFGNNVLMGLGGDDSIEGFGGDDSINGGTGADQIFGGQGNDNLFGAGGRDRLIGGEGDDTLRGGKGADVFVFGYNSGTDTISKYSQKDDQIEIQNHAGGFAGLTISTVGSDLEIQHDGGIIILEGRGAATLTAADFDFV